MSVQSSRATIAKSLKDMEQLWLVTRGSWDDVVSEQFEKEVMEPLAHDFKPAASAMDHIGGIIQQIRRECSE